MHDKEKLKSQSSQLTRTDILLTHRSGGLHCTSPHTSALWQVTSTTGQCAALAPKWAGWTLVHFCHARS
jgi:hypothetical protein